MPYPLVRYVFRCWLLGLLALSPLVARSQPGWRTGFHPPGLNGPISAVVIEPNGDIIAGGDFTNADGHPAADHVARWDGHHWQPLGQGPGAFALTVLQRLPNGHLLAAGHATDSAQTYCVFMRWDGQRWQPLGRRQPGWLTAVAVAPNGDILAAVISGRARCGVVRWNGRDWQPLAPNPPGNQQSDNPVAGVFHLVVTAAGDIVATGRFPGGPYEKTTVARWTGINWAIMAPPAQGYRTAEALTLTPEGEALAGGILTDGHSFWHNYVARWDGSAWQNLGTGPAGQVQSLLVTPTGAVLATTRSNDHYGPVYSFATEHWDGTRWQPFAPARAGGRVRSVRAGAADGSLVGSGPLGLARWDGQTWHDLVGEPTVGFAHTSSRRVTALAVDRRTVVLGGQFYTDSPDRPGVYWFHTQVQRWDGQRRYPLGPDFTGQIEALAVAPNGDVLAAGPFSLPNGPDSIRYVARWDGNHWQPLGTGPPAPVHALAVAPDGTVWAGGDFGLSRWNGTRWQPLPLPTSPDPAYYRYHSPYVRALTIAPNGDVLVGGNFPGSTPYHDVLVIRWNGQRWKLMEGSVESFVTSLAVGRTGEVVVGSGATGMVHESSSDGGSVVRSDKTNPSGWSYWPTRFDGYVHAVAVAPNGDIIAGGSFTSADNKPMHYLARWHNNAWEELPHQGLNGPVRALAIMPDGTLVVGGEFTATGDGAQSLGLWGIYHDH